MEKCQTTGRKLGQQENQLTREDHVIEIELLPAIETQLKTR